MIQSVQRAIDIVNCIDAAGRDLSLPEISNSLNLNVNTTRGLVYTLLVNGFLSKSLATNTYSLGYEFLAKSQSLYEAQIRNIKEIAYPGMKSLAEKFGVSCWLQLNFYNDIYNVEIVFPSNCHYTYAPKSGANLVLHSTASGKLHIAYSPFDNREQIIEMLQMEKLTEFTVTDKEKFSEQMDLIRRQGYSTELEETDIGISSIAVPFFNAHDQLVGTLSVAAPAPTISRILIDVVEDLKRMAGMLTHRVSRGRNQ